MNNSELKQILKSISVPERGTEYWDRFPRQVMFELERRNTQPGRSSASYGTAAQPWWSVFVFKPALAAGLVLFCVVLAFFLGIRQGRHSAITERQLAEAQKCYREIASLFPNQVQALVFDAKGMHLVLSERPDVPTSAPLYIKISGSKGEQRFVTFSGQRIQVNGDSFEVLIDRQGDVLLVGGQSVWSSSEPAGKLGGYRIQARPLPINS